MSTPLRLHLGCGRRHIPGWYHVDLIKYPHVDLVCDVRHLLLDSGCASILYASHVLEHLGRDEVPSVLSEWRRVLRPGGLLRLSVPNARMWFGLYMETLDLDIVAGSIWGGQKDAFDVHRWGYDERTLARTLTRAGFAGVRLWDWRQTEHANVDDYSQAYWPHLQRETGRLMSLNMECDKPRSEAA